jgi:hypothetical protein
MESVGLVRDEEHKKQIEGLTNPGDTFELKGRVKER